MFDAGGAKAHPFLVYKGKLYVGDEGHMHSNLLLQKFKDDDLEYSLDGRIWGKHKIITFWEWPKNVKSFLDKLVKEAASQQKVKIDLKTWKLEVKDPDTKEFIYVPVSEVLSKDTKVIKQGKSVILKHLQSPMDKRRDPVPAGMGSSKKVRGSRSGESPAQTRYRLGMNEARELRDRVIRATAEKAYTDIIAASKRVKDWNKDKAFRLISDKDNSMFFIDLSKIVKDVDELDLVLKQTGGRNYYHIEKNIITISRIPTALHSKLISVTDTDQIAFMFERSMDYCKSTFIHEFIHYVDYTKRGLKKAGTDNRAIGGSGDNSEYFNSPEEMNAYYQQGAAQVDSWMKEIRKDESFVDIIQRRVPKSFNEFIKSEFNINNKQNRVFPIEWLSALTYENKRKFIKRVAPLHKRLTKEIYP